MRATLSEEGKSYRTVFHGAVANNQNKIFCSLGMNYLEALRLHLKNGAISQARYDELSQIHFSESNLTD